MLYYVYKKINYKTQNVLSVIYHLKKGLNLIVDNTDIKFKTDTGNNVGKTTVLQLINFCLGADSETILKR